MAYSHSGTSQSTPSPDHSVTHPAICPVCQKQPTHERHRLSITGLAISTFGCAEGHMWETQWVGAD